MKKNNWQVPITLVFLFLGILLSVQFQAQNRITSDLAMQRTEDLIAMVRGLSDKRQKLALEISDLSTQLYSQQQSDQDEKKLLTSLKNELEKLQIVTGSTALRGPGLEITIEQSAPILYIDLISIVNELWGAGAEAVEINGHRLTASTPIFYGEDEQSMYITVNNHRLQFPIVIKALGNPNNLEKGLTLPGGIMDNLALFKAFPRLKQMDSLTIAPLNEPPVVYFLREYKPPESPGNQEASKPAA